LFDRVVAIAVERGVARGKKMRIDTTVVEAPIRHPTDSRLLEDSVRVLGRHLRRLVQAGVHLAFPLRNTTRSISRYARQIAQIVKQRGDDARKALKKPYRGLLRVTGRWIRQADDAIERGIAALPSLHARAKKAVERSIAALKTMTGRARQVVRRPALASFEASPTPLRS
jgi:hypothetical protein